MWRRRRWRLLLNLIDHLPAASWYGNAIAHDQELAETQADLPAPSGPSEPSWVEWTSQVDLLATIVDRLGELITVQMKAAGGKPKSPKPLPRPSTALQQARRRHRREKHQRTAERVKRREG